MRPSLRDELRQEKPFTSLYQEAYLNLVRTAAELHDAFEAMLKPHDITGTQYNVLRILRGAGPGGLCRNDIRDRMITRMPDVTRLLDRLEEAGLIGRERSGEDRRLVNTTLTKKGRALVDSLDDAVAAEHQRRFGHLTRTQLRTLVELLTLVRRPG